MASKKGLMIARTTEYLALHKEAPERYPRNVEAVAAFVPCSRTLFYKSDPEIQALVDSIQVDVSTDGGGAPLALTPEAEGATLLAEADLEAEVTQAVSRAVWAMQRFVGQHQDSEDGPRGAALAAYDLDTTVHTLRRIQADLAPLVEEVERRQRAAVGRASSPPPDPTLFPEGQACDNPPDEAARNRI